jgi:hypothetical protein
MAILTTNAMGRSEIVRRDICGDMIWMSGLMFALRFNSYTLLAAAC